MTVTGQQGQPLTLDVTFFQYDGGPAVDVTNLTFTIYSYAQASNVLGPTNVGITHIATGHYFVTWNVPANEPVGQYVIIWTATESTISENIIIITTAQATNNVRDPCGWGEPIWSCDM